MRRLTPAPGPPQRPPIVPRRRGRSQRPAPHPPPSDRWAWPVDSRWRPAGRP